MECIIIARIKYSLVQKKSCATTVALSFIIIISSLSLTQTHFSLIQPFYSSFFVLFSFCPHIWGHPETTHFLPVFPPGPCFLVLLVVCAAEEGNSGPPNIWRTFKFVSYCSISLAIPYSTLRACGEVKFLQYSAKQQKSNHGENRQKKTETKIKSKTERVANNQLMGVLFTNLRSISGLCS